jgi:hypothetical protein
MDPVAGQRDRGALSVVNVSRRVGTKIAKVSASVNQNDTRKWNFGSREKEQIPRVKTMKSRIGWEAGTLALFPD